jgi:hypothetical protein
MRRLSGMPSFFGLVFLVAAGYTTSEDRRITKDHSSDFTSGYPLSIRHPETRVRGRDSDIVRNEGGWRKPVVASQESVLDR